MENIRKPILGDIVTYESIVKAVVVLHNFVQKVRKKYHWLREGIALQALWIIMMKMENCRWEIGELKIYN